MQEATDCGNRGQKTHSSTKKGHRRQFGGSPEHCRLPSLETRGSPSPREVCNPQRCSLAVQLRSHYILLRILVVEDLQTVIAKFVYEGKEVFELLLK